MAYKIVEVDPTQEYSYRWQVIDEGGKVCAQANSRAAAQEMELELLKAENLTRGLQMLHEALFGVREKVN